MHRNPNRWVGDGLVLHYSFAGTDVHDVLALAGAVGEVLLGVCCHAEPVDNDVVTGGGGRNLLQARWLEAVGDRMAARGLAATPHAT